jgi:hypothetical protein
VIILCIRATRWRQPLKEFLRSAEENWPWLLSGFGVVIGGSCDQGSDEGAEQSLSPPPGVVDELKEAKVGGQLLL